jgi:hypothetical protein
MVGGVVQVCIRHGEGIVGAGPCWLLAWCIALRKTRSMYSIWMMRKDILQSSARYWKVRQGKVRKDLFLVIATARNCYCPDCHMHFTAHVMSLLLISLSNQFLAFVGTSRCTTNISNHTRLATERSFFIFPALYTS